MNPTVPPRGSAARLRTAVLGLGALLAAAVMFAAGPASALAGTHHAGARHRRHAVHHRRVSRRHAHRARRHPRHQARRHARHHARHHRRRIAHRVAPARPDTTAGAPLCPDSHARIGHVSRATTERATLCVLNLQRARHGLPRLRGSQPLDDSAQRWTNTMVHDRAFSHGADFGARISAAGFNWSHIGENIADGFHTPAGAVRAWMHSTGHCENILTPDFREAGAGFDHGSAEGHAFRWGTWTLDFGLKMRQHAPSNNWAPAEGCPY
jgi:uncharacterized protein YkwD